MQILLGSTEPRLELWEARPFNVGDVPLPSARHDAYERVVAFEAPGPPAADGPFERVSREVMAYRVFSPRLIAPILRRVPVRVGDTVGARFRVVPGLGLFFASRVVAVVDDFDGRRYRRGFTYRTLRGHPEIGEETFSVEKEARTGLVSVALRAWSTEGLWVMRLGAPLGRWLQRVASLGAVRNLQRAAH